MAFITAFSHNCCISISYEASQSLLVLYKMSVDIIVLAKVLAFELQKEID